jgi:hypothetical protein
LSGGASASYGRFDLHLCKEDHGEAHGAKSSPKSDQQPVGDSTITGDDGTGECQSEQCGRHDRSGPSQDPL